MALKYDLHGDAYTSFCWICLGEQGRGGWAGGGEGWHAIVVHGYLTSALTKEYNFTVPTKLEDFWSL